MPHPAPFPGRGVDDFVAKVLEVEGPRPELTGVSILQHHVGSTAYTSGKQWCVG